MNYCVYFITEESTNSTKVGYACNLSRRLEALQIGNPSELWVSATITGLNKQSAMSLEIYLHRRFSRHHIRGEWFSSGIFFCNWFSERFRLPSTAKINLIDLPIQMED